MSNRVWCGLALAGVWICGPTQRAMAQPGTGGAGLGGGLYSAPALANSGDRFILCATNVGSTPVSVSLDLVDAMTGVVVLHSSAALGNLIGSTSALQPGACVEKAVPPGPTNAPGSTAIIAILIGRVTVNPQPLPPGTVGVVASLQIVQSPGGFEGNAAGGGLPGGSGLIRTMALAPLPCSNPCCGN